MNSHIQQNTLPCCTLFYSQRNLDIVQCNQTTSVCYKILFNVSLQISYSKLVTILRIFMKKQPKTKLLSVEKTKD